MTNELGMVFVYIEPGTFMMGSPSNVLNRSSDERQHRVTLTRGYYMQTTPVTQGQWKAVMGDNPGDLSRYAWYSENSGSRTHPVGQKPANCWGLHDVHGNVWEWVADWYGDYPCSAVTDPAGPSSGLSRVLRGGCWGSHAGDCRSAGRIGLRPDGRFRYNGFRLARLLGQ